MFYTAALKTFWNTLKHFWHYPNADDEVFSKYVWKYFQNTVKLLSSSETDLLARSSYLDIVFLHFWSIGNELKTILKVLHKYLLTSLASWREAYVLGMFPIETIYTRWFRCVWCALMSQRRDRPSFISWIMLITMGSSITRWYSKGHLFVIPCCSSKYGSVQNDLVNCVRERTSACIIRSSEAHNKPWKNSVLVFALCLTAQAHHVGTYTRWQENDNHYYKISGGFVAEQTMNGGGFWADGRNGVNLMPTIS